MTKPDENGKAKPDARQQRLAAKLRENLRRRKQQAQRRKTGSGEGGEAVRSDADEEGGR